MNTKQTILTGMKVLLTIAVITFSLAALQRLLMPKYAGENREGALIDDYYAEERHDFDVLILGDCEAYENISTVSLWEEYGINSFIRGSAAQTLWQSYYLLEDSLRFYKPSIVVLNVLAFIYDEPQNEAYNRMTLDGMQWSPYKISAVNASMMPDENFLSYLFPLLRFHDRWDDLTGDDFRYFFRNPIVSYNGYLMNTEVKPAENVPTGRVLGSYTFGDNAMTYLDKIRRLCQEQEIELLLMKAPSLYPYWYDEYDSQVTAYAREHGLRYVNFLRLREETGIDYTTDTYDAGLHLNVYGAEKLSRVLGHILTEELGVPDRRNEEDLVNEWKMKTERYLAERDEGGDKVEEKE